VEGMDDPSEILAIYHSGCTESSLGPVLHKEGMSSFSLPGRYKANIVPAGSFLLESGGKCYSTPSRASLPS
jgi:hypothetical protein